MANKKVSDKDYLFISSMLKARENRMLRRDRLEQMLSSGSFEEAARLLAEIGWPDLSGKGSAAVSEALAKRQAEIYAEITRFVPEKELVGIFRLKYDYHNAKTIVKGEGAAYNVTGSQTNAGSSDNTFTYTLNQGTKAKNYTVETKPGKLTVTPVTAEVTVTITGNDGSMGYDGNEHSVTGYKVESISNPLYTAADFAFSGTDSVTGTDAGTYMMGLTPAQFENTNPNFENVTFSVTDGALTITPMPLTITAGSDSKAYNGTPLTNDTFTRTSLAAGDTLASVTVTGSQTDVGSSKNVASDAKLMRGDRDVTANYAIDYLPGTLTVTKNESAKLTAEAYKGVYDGGEHDAVVKTALSDLVDDSVWTYSYSLDGEHYTDEMPQVKNVGAYPVWVKATNDNYVDLVTVVTAEDTPATVLVTADSHEWIIAVKDTCVGDPEPALTYQAESPVAGETPAFSGELSREPGAERGKTYQILQGDLALADGENFLASNYVLQFVPGELTVKARDITIFQKDYFPCGSQKSRNIRGDKAFIPTDAQQKRRGVSRGVKHARLIRVNHDYGIGPVRASQRPRKSFTQPGTVKALFTNEMGEHFGIRIRGEGMPPGLQFIFQFLEILDNPVMDNGNSAILGNMGMGVSLHRKSMRGPSGMPDSRKNRNRLFSRDFFFQYGKFSRRFDNVEPALLFKGHAGGIIAAIFQTPQPVNQQGNGRFSSSISNNSAHNKFSAAQDNFTCISS